MGKHWDPKKLDAYGHLEWTVGNEDYIVCLDAILSDDYQEVIYHCVVNCESGGFTETAVSGSFEIAHAVHALADFPAIWANAVRDQYAEEDTDSKESPYFISPEETATTAASWKRHLEALVAESRKRCPAEPIQVDENIDPIRDGWVGKDGRP